MMFTELESEIYERLSLSSASNAGRSKGLNVTDRICCALVDDLSKISHGEYFDLAFVLIFIIQSDTIYLSEHVIVLAVELQHRLPQVIFGILDFGVRKSCRDSMPVDGDGNP
jgi:hypothetical protein